MLHFRTKADVAKLRVYDANVGTGAYTDPFKTLDDFDDLGDCHLDVGSTLGIKSIWLQVSCGANAGTDKIRYYREFQQGEFALLFLNYNLQDRAGLIQPADLYVGQEWTYANTTARVAATGFNEEDIGKLAYQIDAVAGYRLTAIAPAIIWTAVPTPEMDRLLKQAKSRPQIASGLFSLPQVYRGHTLFLDTIAGDDGAAYKNGGFTITGGGTSKFAFRTYVSYSSTKIQSVSNLFLLDHSGFFPTHDILTMRWPYNSLLDANNSTLSDEPHAWWEWDSIPRQPQFLTGASPPAGYSGPSPEKFSGWPGTYFGNSGIVRAFPATYWQHGPPGAFAASSVGETFLNVNNGNVYQAQGSTTNWVLIGNISTPNTTATGMSATVTGWRNSATIKAGLESGIRNNLFSSPLDDGFWEGLFLKFSMDEDIATYVPNHNLGY